MATTPLLSIGIIFKNEERCIERCLRSLEPLRRAVPCEVVMADTGATDGSRGIARRYADVVFDFPWVDDFSAARNAVMDRCQGRWYLTIDCDEWLDADISELTHFLWNDSRAELALVIQRNYGTPALEKSEVYNDFRALRLVRLASGQRYQGAIHESWIRRGQTACLLHTVLHHDGYVLADPEEKEAKHRRNLALLQKKLQQEPEDLYTLNQWIESGREDADLVANVRRAVQLVKDRRGQWQLHGASLLRHAVEAAYQHKLPELDEWVELAEREFPDSIFVQIDLQASAFAAAYDAQEWKKAVSHGEACRRGIRRLRAGAADKKLGAELERGGLSSGSPAFERWLQIMLAGAYREDRQDQKALRLLEEVEAEKLPPDLVGGAVMETVRLHAETMLDVSRLLAGLYERIGREEPDRQTRQARLDAFDEAAAEVFAGAYREEEKTRPGTWRPACTAFGCLAGQCEAGRAAAIMMTSDPAEMREWLAKVENWQALPIEALGHALRAGVAFPLEEKPLTLEVLDGLAAKLARGDNMARQLALALSEDQEYPGLQGLFWARSLVLAALEGFDWTLGKKDAAASEFARPERDAAAGEKPADTAEEGLALIRRFARIEAALLPILCTPQALAEENAALLPPVHRWGLYCAQALEALDAGKPQEYLALLRRGLAACPGQKEMVQFLLDRFREDARPAASPELLALAEKVRTILAAYDPADPAVAALKASPAYRQVAWLVEEANAGGLPS